MYYYFNNNWKIIDTQYGKEVGDRLGNSISISLDGNVVAAGAKLNDDNGNKSGQVRIFQIIKNSSETSIGSLQAPIAKATINVKFFRGYY